MNKKGFTLVELLGVITILAIILLIALPNITRLVDRTKKDGYINDAKKLSYLVKSEIKAGYINKPANGETVKVTLKDLATNDLEKDKDGYTYDIEKSYVYVTRENGNIVYYAQLLSKKKNNTYRGILLTNAEELEQEERYEKYFEDIETVNEMTPQELNENKKFEVGLSRTNVNLSTNKVSIRYGKTNDVVVTPQEGYYLASVSCTNGYTTNANTGVSQTQKQTVTIRNNNSNKQSTCTFIGKKIVYKADIITENTTSQKASIELKYGGTASFDVTPKAGYYLASVECTNGYQISADLGIDYQVKQTVTINNNRVKDISECTLISYRAYPVVTGDSNTWTTGTRTFEVKDPIDRNQVIRYEYYVSNSKTKPSRSVTPTGRFNNETVTIVESGKYIYFRIVYATGVISDWTSAKNLYVDSNTIASPSVIGGGSELTLSKTFMVLSPESTSGVSEYQYYVSDSQEKPARSVTPTASLTEPLMNIETTGKYVYFRVINNARIMSDWTDAINLFVDTNTYTITYNLNGGEQGSNAKKKFNVETPDFNLPQPTRVGYTFAGWYQSSSFSGNIISKITKGTQGNKTLYAKWTPIVYVIDYSLNGGTIPDGSPYTYTIETNTFNLPTPTRNGYAFKGWYETDESVKVSQLKKGTIGNKKYNASWEANIYTLTLDKQSGTGGTNTIQATYDQPLSNITPPTRNGYAFNGYYSINGTTQKQYYNSEGTGVTLWDKSSNTTLYAKWNILTYTITYLLNEGTQATNPKVTYTVEDETFNLPIPTRSKYNFDGWFTSSNLSGSPVTQITKGTTGNKVYYAGWTLASYPATHVTSCSRQVCGNRGHCDSRGICHDHDGSAYCCGDYINEGYGCWNESYSCSYYTCPQGGSPVGDTCYYD